MPEPVSINPDEPLNKGLDYVYLKGEGTALVQQLAGEIWTNYNESDPGVTTLEQLCYALTELSYRAEFPLEDLLVERPNGRINTRRQAMFIPRRILPCNPLTENDYRKLIVDRVPGVANCWLTPYRSPDPSKFVNGLYDIWLYVPSADPCACDDRYLPDVIRKRVRRVYCRHRNLCEDVHDIYILEPLRTEVYAHATIDNTRTPEAILASLFFNIGNYLAPELRRLPLKSQLEAGKTPDEIFNGPLLRNGFIDDDQLQPKAKTIPVQEIVRVIVRTAGVLSARNVSVRLDDEERKYDGNQSFPVKEKQIPQLYTRPDDNGSFTIRLFKDGIECKPDPVRVGRELDKLWAEYRRTYKLMPQYEEFFAVPRGSYRDVEQYYSVQNQFPNVYGINAYGLPEDASNARKAQARQLKGYLLAFEQLMADFFAQLARAKDLYSTDYELRHTYFYQYLIKSVPNVLPLLKDGYRNGLSLIVDSQDPFLERRNRFLDFLLALYAEKLDASSTPELTCESQQGGYGGEREIKAKLTLLHRLVVSTHNRGRGFDYLAPPSPHNIAGMEIKSRIQLGMNALERLPLIEMLDDLALKLVESDSEATVGIPISRHTDHIEGDFAPITSFGEDRKPTDQEKQLAQPVSLLRAQAVTEEFLRAAGEVENYRVGSLPGEKAVAVVCKSRSQKNWRLIGKYPDLESALAVAYALADIAKAFNRRFQQLYIVEHNLLRFAQYGPDDSGPVYEDKADDGDYNRRDSNDNYPDEGGFVYSFTITAVISVSPQLRYDSQYHTIVREVIRQNTPAHIVVEYCFLSLWQLRIFEFLYWDWQQALRNGTAEGIKMASAALQRFLEQCQYPPAQSET